MNDSMARPMRLRLTARGGVDAGVGPSAVAATRLATVSASRMYFDSVSERRFPGFNRIVILREDIGHYAGASRPTAKARPPPR